MVAVSKHCCAYLFLVQHLFLLLVTMSANTTIAQHDPTPHDRGMGTELDVRDATNNTEKEVVNDADAENDAHPISGGLKAWLYVLATFLMFVSAW